MISPSQVLGTFWIIPDKKLSFLEISLVSAVIDLFAEGKLNQNNMNETEEKKLQKECEKMARNGVL